jgi:hypothetical protein
MKPFIIILLHRLRKSLLQVSFKLETLIQHVCSLHHPYNLLAPIRFVLTETMTHGQGKAQKRIIVLFCQVMFYPSIIGSDEEESSEAQ